MSFTNSNKLTVSQLGPSCCITQTSGCHFGTNEQLSTRIILSWFLTHSLTHSLHRPKKTRRCSLNDSVLEKNRWLFGLVPNFCGKVHPWWFLSSSFFYAIIQLLNRGTVFFESWIDKDNKRPSCWASGIKSLEKLVHNGCKSRVGRTLLTILEKKQGKHGRCFFADWLSSTNQV